MINIRKSLFETNSSSTHSICISKHKNYEIPKSLFFSLGEYGWQTKILTSSEELASYLYTGICYCFKEKEREDFKNYIFKTLAKYDCIAEFENAEPDPWELVSGIIDHAEELKEFFNAIKGSESCLLKYLFSPDSFIITGNDNDDGYYNLHKKTDFSNVKEFIKGC